MDDRIKVKEHFNKIAKDYDFWKNKNRYYYEQIKNFYQKKILPHKKVLELGCGTGEILNCVNPAYGVGNDISEEMVKLAQNKFPDLKFVTYAAEGMTVLTEKFEYIIMCDLLDHVSDIFEIFKNLENLAQENSKLIITTVNPIWDPVFMALEKWKMKMPEGPHNFLFKADIITLLKLFGYDIQEEGLFLLLPVYVPFLSTLVNRYFCHLPLIKNLCLVQYIIANKTKEKTSNRELSCSVIVPCFNESENVAECLRRIPQMGKFTEVILVDDGSKDDTAEIVKNLIHGNQRVKLLSYQPNRGKAYAIKAGFDMATGDVLMILDADMTVMPEDLEKFFWTISIPGVDFVNGTRMVYPMENEAMRGLNLLGNKIFSLIFSWLLGQRITDTLCGTKVILKETYRKINMTSYDQWGDFDLLLSVAKLQLNIIEMPVRYKRRVKGESKMRPFKHGLLLLLRVLRGFKEMKLDKWFKNKASVRLLI